MVASRGGEFEGYWGGEGVSVRSSGDLVGFKGVSRVGSSLKSNDFEALVTFASVIFEFYDGFLIL